MCSRILGKEKPQRASTPRLEHVSRVKCRCRNVEPPYSELKTLLTSSVQKSVKARGEAMQQNLVKEQTKEEEWVTPFRALKEKCDVPHFPMGISQPE